MLKNKFLSLLILLIVPRILFSFAVTKVPDISPLEQFEISPAKINFEMSAGQTALSKIYVLNRSLDSSDFNIEFENGDKNKGDFVTYSKVDRDYFTLLCGEKAEVALTITLPENYDGGDIDGVVFVSSQKTEDVKESSGTKILSRLGMRVSIKIIEKENKLSNTTDNISVSYIIFAVIFFILLFVSVIKFFR